MEEEIINPDQLRNEPGKLVNGSAHRFTCPKCGGKMVYSPDGSEIICEFCANQKREKARKWSSGEQDFFLAMATRKGHFARWIRSPSIVKVVGASLFFRQPA